VRRSVVKYGSTWQLGSKASREGNSGRDENASTPEFRHKEGFVGAVQRKALKQHED